jgi:transposase
LSYLIGNSDRYRPRDENEELIERSSERTFSWFGRNRRLAKDFENLAENLAAFVALACIQIAARA